MRPMDGWWRRTRFFIRFMIREATAVLVVAYATVLLFGVIRLAQGESAYDAWLASLRESLVGCLSHRPSGQFCLSHVELVPDNAENHA
jgi:fumarate reductase subunit C